MRVEPTARLPRGEDGKRLLAELERLLREHAAAINSNAGSAELVDAVADLPAASAVQGRFYFVLGTSSLRFSDGTDWYTVDLTVVP